MTSWGGGGGVRGRYDKLGGGGGVAGYDKPLMHYYM